MTVATNLSPADRGTVDRVRQTLAESIAADHGTADTVDLLLEIGRLQSSVEGLLRVIDNLDTP